MSLFRILLSPGPEEGANASSEELVTISRSELDALRARAEGAPAGRIESADEPEATARAARAEVAGFGPDREACFTREIAARDRKVAELDQAYRGALRERELATALAGKALVAGAAAQLIKLWRDDFDVYEEEGAYRVASRDGRTVAQAIAERLAHADYAHFCLPSSRGGTGIKDASRPVAGTAAPGPKNLGEAILLQWRKDATTRTNDPTRPIGLGRRR